MKKAIIIILAITIIGIVYWYYTKKKNESKVPEKPYDMSNATPHVAYAIKPTQIPNPKMVNAADIPEIKSTLRQPSIQIQPNGSVISVKTSFVNPFTQAQPMSISTVSPLLTKKTDKDLIDRLNQIERSPVDTWAKKEMLKN